MMNFAADLICRVADSYVTAVYKFYAIDAIISILIAFENHSTVSTTILKLFVGHGMLLTVSNKIQQNDNVNIFVV